MTVKSKPKRKWKVEVTYHIDNKDCPARTKRNGKWWCDEMDKKCCEEKCYGVEA
jgi:hypothetical protein